MRDEKRTELLAYVIIILSTINLFITLLRG